MMEFTFLMPCLNEEAALPFCIDEIQSAIHRLDLSAEILVADNGSVDRSVEVAQNCGARVVHVDQRGYGATLIGGIKAAHGKYIIMGDCDGSYDFATPTVLWSSCAAARRWWWEIGLPAALRREPCHGATNGGCRCCRHWAGGGSTPMCRTSTAVCGHLTEMPPLR